MKRFVATSVALLAVVLADTPAVAVDEGVPDRARHPYVGVLGADPDGEGPGAPFGWCTGSVVSDRVFLTAAHCINALPPETVWYVTLEPGSPRAPVLAPGVFPDDFPFPAVVPMTRAKEAVMHPDFFETDTAIGHDVAVVLFERGTFAGVEPMQLPTEHQLNRIGLKRSLIRLVGYGSDPEHGDGETVFVVEGYRQTALAPFRRLTSRELQLDGDAAATRLGGLCIADSGSPQLLEGTNLALSTFTGHSPDVQDCRGVTHSQRLDTRSERRFLARYAP